MQTAFQNLQGLLRYASALVQVSFYFFRSLLAHIRSPLLKELARLSNLTHAVEHAEHTAQSRANNRYASFDRYTKISINRRSLLTHTRSLVVTLLTYLSTSSSNSSSRAAAASLQAQAAVMIDR